MILREIGKAALLTLAGFILGTAVMFTWMTDHQAKKVASAAKEVVAETTQAMVTSVKENAVIETKLESKSANAEALKQSIAKELKPAKEVVYVQVQVPGKSEAQVCPQVDGGTPVPLSSHSVRLLNDLRAAKTVDLTAGPAEKVFTPAGTTFAEFVSNDIDVVRLYNDLAARHDELVDRVVAYMDEQAKTASK